MKRLLVVIKKEFIQIRRDPMVIRLIMIAPIIQLIAFGYAATNDVRNVTVAVYDGDRSADSRQIIREIAGSPYFHLAPAGDDPRALENMLLTGHAQIGVHIPRDFHRKLMRGEQAQIGLVVDGTDSNTAGVASGYLAGILRKRAVALSIRRARADGTLGADLPGLTPEPRVWFNEELKSVNYMVPGVFGMILLVITVNLAGLSIVREREMGTLEQLMVTPLRSRELLPGKLIPFAILSLLDSGLIFLVAIGWFKVPFRGSLLILFSMAAVFLISNLGLGLLISATSRTQQEAQVVAFLLIMPSVLLSGFMFPIQNMPQAIQYLTYFIPFRYFLEIIRGVFLKGVGVSVLWPQIGALIFFAALQLGLGIAVFRKRL